MDFFYEIFKKLPRQGPGCTQITKKAFECIPEHIESPVIIDIGCGTGTQTLDLAMLSGGLVYALDNYKPFLDILSAKAEQKNLQITPVCGSMDNLPFNEKFFDIVWAEGSIYNIGVKKGLCYFKKFLKPGGYLACSEVVWLKNNPPAELKQFWNNDYPAMTDITSCIDIIKSAGYILIDNFTLSKNAWTDNYYTPLLKLIDQYSQSEKDNPQIISFLELMKKETEIFHKYNQWFGYEFFIMRKQ